MQPYTCGNCGYTTLEISDLHDHLVRHDGSIGYYFNIGDSIAFPKWRLCDREPAESDTDEEMISEEVFQDVEQVIIKNEHGEVIKQEPTETLEENEIMPEILQDIEQIKSENEIGESQETDWVGEDNDLPVDCEGSSEYLDQDVTKNRESMAQSVPGLEKWLTGVNKIRGPRGRFITKRQLLRNKNLKTFKIKAVPANGNSISNPKTQSSVYFDTRSAHADQTTSVSYDVNEPNTVSMRRVIIEVKEDTEEKHTCILCTFSCTSASKINAHYQSHYVKKKAPEHACCICESCGMTFSSRDSFNSHRRNICFKKHECETCGVKFSKPSRLDYHVRVVHLGEIPEKPFVCDKCGKKFRKLSLVNKHQKIVHTDERKYKCDKCGKAFKNHAILNRHAKIHLDHFTHHCGVCGKGFAEQWNMKAHMRQHSGDKPYACSKCGERFTHNVSRKTHEAKCLYISPENTMIPPENATIPPENTTIP